MMIIYTCSALNELGYKYEEHEIPQSLYGFQGDERQQKANIIIRRSDVGSASNDIGFVKSGDKYNVIISEYDQRLYGKKFGNHLTQLYAKYKFIKQAKKMGYTIKSQKEENGRIKIRVMGR